MKKLIVVAGAALILAGCNQHNDTTAPVETNNSNRYETTNGSAVTTNSPQTPATGGNP